MRKPEIVSLFKLGVAMECLVNRIPFAPGLKLGGVNQRLQVKISKCVSKRIWILQFNENKSICSGDFFIPIFLCSVRLQCSTKPIAYLNVLEAIKNASVITACYCNLLCFRATSSHCSTSAILRGCNLPLDTAECQFHQWGWAHYPKRSWVSHFKWKLVWHTTRGLHKL